MNERKNFSDESIGRHVLSDPHAFRERVPRDLENWWDPFTVSVIEVDVVVVGVEQDEEDEDEFANVDSQHGNIGLELGFSLKTRPIFFPPRREDRDLGVQFEGK